MLRAVRFAARLGLLLSLLQPQPYGIWGVVQLVAAERVRDELVRILTEGGAKRGLELLDELGLLEAIFPEVHG